MKNHVPKLRGRSPVLVNHDLKPFLNLHVNLHVKKKVHLKLHVNLQNSEKDISRSLSHCCQIPKSSNAEYKSRKEE